MNDVIGKWCFSVDEESYSGKFDTEKDARLAAHEQLYEDCLPGQLSEYWIAQCVHPIDTISPLIGEDVMEMLDCRMQDEICADEPCLDMSIEDERLLGQMIIDFIRTNSVVQYYGVSAPTKYSFEKLAT